MTASRIDDAQPGNPLVAASRWIGEGRRVAIATVIGTWGSSPCQPGSQLAVNEDGAFEGSVSGGCVEGEVVRAALEIIESGGIRQVEFGVSDDRAWEVGLACGGTVRIFVEAVS